jgi:hypothetical protein
MTSALVLSALLLAPGADPPDTGVCKTVSGFGTAVPRGRAVEREVPVTMTVPVQAPRGDVKREPIEVRTPVAAILRDSLWANGQTLVVQFMDGREEAALLRAVERYARQWEVYTNLRFVFLRPGQRPQDFGEKLSHIRVSFSADGHWSYVGRQSIDDAIAPQTRKSMNLQLTRDTRQEDIRRVVLHEFGHALGFEHEHQNPKGGIKWKQPDAMNYYKRTMGWAEDKIEFNIFRKITGVPALNTAFDKNSIMLYWIPPGLTEDGFSVGWNTNLSSVDTASASAVYPPVVDEKGRTHVKASPGFLPAGVVVCSIDERTSPFVRMTRVDDQGRVIRVRYPDGRFRPAGGTVEPGDVIVRINGAAIRTVAEYKAAVAKLKGGFSVRVRDVQSGQEFNWRGNIP